MITGCRTNGLLVQWFQKNGLLELWAVPCVSDNPSKLKSSRQCALKSDVKPFETVIVIKLSKIKLTRL